MKTAKFQLQTIPHALAHLLVRILTSSYAGALRYHTLKPMKLIAESQSSLDQDDLIKALASFRQTKSEELSFVAKAAALSAAAVIGVFSWPSAERTVWPAKLLWNWSFFLSTFSLISSAPTRLLTHLPEKHIENDSTTYKNHPAREYTEADIQVALNLFLQPASSSSTPSANMTDPSADKGLREQRERRISKRMLWIWQCPTMLMSYSWVFFLVGYALHVLTPVFNDDVSSRISSTVALITVCGCALIVLNFVFCAALCQIRIQKGDERLDGVLGWMTELKGRMDHESRSKSENGGAKGQEQV